MYAILAHGGRQYRVSAGDRLVVDRLDAEVGSVIELAPVLLTGGEGEASLGDAVDGMRVAATVVAHTRGPKLRIFKYKAKKRYRRAAGHRSDLTEVHVESIVAKGEALPASSVAARPARIRPSDASTRAGAGRATAARAAARRATPAARSTAPRTGRTERSTARARGEAATEAAATPEPKQPRQPKAAAGATSRTASPPKAAAKPATAKAAPKAAAKPAPKPRSGKAKPTTKDKEAGGGA